VGLAQLAAVAASSLQVKVDPVLLELKEKPAVVALVGFAGFAVNVTLGAAVSTVQV
jgi:hypothetical protein